MRGWLLYIALGYAILINLVTFIVYGVDKHRAEKNSTRKKPRRRIPEATLLWLAVWGGSIGALLAMKVFRHKTQHKKFTILVPLILLAQLALIGYAMYLAH